MIEEAQPTRPGVSAGAATAPDETTPKKVSTRGKSPTAIALARLRKDKVAMICLGVFIFFILIAIFAPLLTKLEGQDTSTLHQDLIDQYGFPTIGPDSTH